jgi:hypothetical protein
MRCSGGRYIASPGFTAKASTKALWLRSVCCSKAKSSAAKGDLQTAAQRIEHTGNAASHGRDASTPLMPGKNPCL